MALLKGIWRPDQPPRKGPNPHGDSVLTERLAELLGREVEELRETPEAPAPDLTPQKSPKTEDGEQVVLNQSASAPSSLGVAEEEHPATPARPSSRRGTKSSGANGGTVSIPQATKTALEQLRATHEEIESSLRSRAQEYERALEATMSGLDQSNVSEKAAEAAAQQFRTEARQWFDEARRELRDQLEASRSSIESQLRDHHADLLRAARDKIESMTRASLEADAVAARHAGQEQVEHWLKEQGDLSRRQTEAGAQSLAQATEQALTRLRATEEKIEAAFRTQVEEYRRVVQAATAELEQKGISQAQFQNAAEELNRLTSQVLDGANKRIAERAEDAINRIGEKLTAAEQSLGAAARAAMQGAIEEQQQRVADVWQDRTRTALESVSLAGQQGRTQIEEARKAAEKEFQSAAQEQGRRLVDQVASELQSSEFRDRALSELRKQMDQAARELLARSTTEMGKQSELAVSGLSNLLDKTTQGFLGQVQQRVEAAGPAWLEAAGQTVQQEYRARIAKWLEEQTETTRRQAAEAARNLEQATAQAAARLESVSRETESTLQSRLQAQQEQWVEAALEQTRKSGFERKVVDQALAELERNSAKFVEETTRRLTEQASASRESIAKQMEGSAQKLLEGVEASLENISWQHRGRLAQWWEERSQTARREAEVAAQSVSQAAQQATSYLRTTQSEIETELKSRARDHQMQLLDSAMEEMRSSGAIERTVNEASAALSTNAREVIARAAEQLRDQMEKARTGLESQSLTVRRTMGDELARKVEQAQSSVEGASKALTEDYRRQLAVWWEERSQSSQRDTEEAARTISRSAKQASEQLQTVQKQITTELETGMENYRRGLRDAAADELRRQGFQKDILDSVAGELNKAAQELTQRSTGELQRQIEKTLSGLDQKVQSSRQTLIEDSQKHLSEMVRTSIDAATSRFHELITKNAADLEHEQEEWLQRKREAVWLEINKRTAASSKEHHPSSFGTFGAASQEAGQQKNASGAALGRLLIAAVVLALAAGLTAAFMKLAPPPTVVMQLDSSPPAGFVQQDPHWGAQQRARELQLADAYWMIAINDLEHKYAYNTPLPDTPPSDFHAVVTGQKKEDPAARLKYWGELKKVWTSPDAWQKITVSGGGPLSGAVEWVRARLAGSPKPQQATTNQ